jgi:hypothetical protein
MKQIPSRSTRTHYARTAILALSLALGTSACVAQRSSPLVMAAVPESAPLEDRTIVTAFRALLDQVIGDSADKVCLSVAHATGTGEIEDSDPNAVVMHALRGGSTAVLPHSVCAADERNFGNPRGLLRLRDVSAVDERTLMVHAEVIGDHSARYECLVPQAAHGATRAHCKITERDWPGSQKRS